MTEAGGAAPVEMRRVHPATLLLRLFAGSRSLIFLIPAALAMMASGQGWGLVALVAALAIGTATTLILRVLRWRRFQYGLAEREIVIEGGVFNRFRRSIPLTRIQDVSIDRGPVARLLGLALVKIETGGGGRDEGLLDSVAVEEAERIKAFVRTAKARLAEAAPVPDGAPARNVEAAEAPEDEILFQMSTGRVVLSGLFRFSFAWLVIVGFFAQFFFEFFDFDPFGFDRMVREATEAVAEQAAGLVRASRIALLVLSALIALGAIVLGVAAGIAGALLRDYGFSLKATADRFLCERGLLTHRQTAAVRRRIQLARLSTSPLRRRFGWHELSFQSLGGADLQGGHLTAAPFAKLEEIDRILATQPPLGDERPSRLEGVSVLHFLRRLAGVLVVATGVSIGFLFFPPAGLLYIVPILLAVAAWMGWRAHGYFAAERALFLRRGAWPSHLWIIPYRSIECLTLRQGPVQRLFGVATLSIDTPGGSAVSPTLVADLPLDRARALMASIKARRLVDPGAPRPSSETLFGEGAA